MKTYVIRFRDPKRGSAFCEIVAGTEADARADFNKCFPGCEIISSHKKPLKLLIPDLENRGI